MPFKLRTLYSWLFNKIKSDDLLYNRKFYHFLDEIHFYNF
jgi:hypothetical protein